ncbi:hypothetical protein BaRGS_00004186 [Batillaria attramentaria]|uniref:Uncharacterized protein n=1 Tax=Batillaria attramentaria TaxID=370345 RepID=A0ABD0LYT2_9CAEN
MNGWLAETRTEHQSRREARAMLPMTLWWRKVAKSMFTRTITAARDWAHHPIPRLLGEHGLEPSMTGYIIVKGSSFRDSSQHSGLEFPPV